MALICLIGGRLAFFFRHPDHVNDFDNLYYAAVHLLRGENPYPIARQWWTFPLFYPLPAVLFAVPFTLVSLEVARPLVDIGVGSAFAYGLWKVRGPYALLALLSGSYIAALRWGQTTPLMVAASLLPALGFLLVVKPNMGSALWLARPSRAAAIGGASFLLLSLLVLPSWPLDWIAALRQQNEHLRPLIFRPLGFLLLLAAVRWRTPEGRLLVALAVIPQNVTPFELVPLALIPSNLIEMCIYLVGTLLTLGPMAVGFERRLPLATMSSNNWPWMLGAVYLPMLWLVLRRRTEENDL